jgi:hypothetical protein
VSLEVGFLPASLQSLSDTSRLLYIAPPHLSLIYAVEFGDVGEGVGQYFPSIAATWLYKVFSRFGTGAKITIFLNFSLKYIDSVFPHFLLMKLFF